MPANPPKKMQAQSLERKCNPRAEVLTLGRLQRLAVLHAEQITRGDSFFRGFQRLVCYSLSCCTCHKQTLATQACTRSTASAIMPWPCCKKCMKRSRRIVPDGSSLSKPLSKICGQTVRRRCKKPGDSSEVSMTPKKTARPTTLYDSYVIPIF